MDARLLLRRMFDAAIAAAQPALCVPPHLPAPPQGARHRHRRRQGVGRHGAGARGPLARAAVGRSSSRASAIACRASASRCRGRASGARRRRGRRRRQRIADRVRGLTADDLVHRLDLRRRLGFAGRAAAGRDAGRQAAVERGSAASGATICEMNCVRRHLSSLKGGRLGALCAPAPRRRVADLRRARRRSDRHRLRADRCRSHHLRRCARRAGAL